LRNGHSLILDMLMAKYIIQCLLCLYVLSASAQDSALNNKKTIITAEAGSQGIGLSAEWMHGHTLTLETSTFLGPSYSIDDQFLSFILTPSYSRPAMRFSITPRLYMNKAGRMKERRKKYTHADFYMGLGYSYVTSSFDRFNNAANFFTLHFGWRQFFSSRGMINAHIGPGFAVSSGFEASTFYPSVGLKLGYRLN
jgi:hypothetical protein